jgi:hypothetical protein
MRGRTANVRPFFVLAARLARPSSVGCADTFSRGEKEGYSPDRRLWA